MHRSDLDKAEGFGSGYEVKEIKIKTFTDEEIEAFTYYASNIDENLQPYHWYKKHVVYGVKENSFPNEYIEKIESIVSIDDHNAERVQREMSIHINS